MIFFVSLTQSTRKKFYPVLCFLAALIESYRIISDNNNIVVDHGTTRAVYRGSMPRRWSIFVSWLAGPPHERPA